MTEALTKSMVHGNGFKPKDVPEDVKTAARKVFCEIYADFYTARHLKAVADGYHDDDLEMQLAVKAILGERERHSRFLDVASDKLSAIEARLSAMGGVRLPHPRTTTSTDSAGEAR